MKTVKETSLRQPQKAGIRFPVLGTWQLLENQGTFSVQTQLFRYSPQKSK